jgi:hypothetical protein
MDVKLSAFGLGSFVTRIRVLLASRVAMTNLDTATGPAKLHRALLCLE